MFLLTITTVARAELEESFLLRFNTSKQVWNNIDNQQAIKDTVFFDKRMIVTQSNPFLMIILTTCRKPDDKPRARVFVIINRKLTGQTWPHYHHRTSAIITFLPNSQSN